MEKFTICGNDKGTFKGIFIRFFNSLVKRKQETVYPRFLRYLNEAHRDGVIGDGRYAVAIGKAEKLHRFLIIRRRSKMSVKEFTADVVLDFRQFD